MSKEIYAKKIIDIHLIEKKPLGFEIWPFPAIFDGFHGNGSTNFQKLDIFDVLLVVSFNPTTKIKKKISNKIFFFITGTLP